MKVSIKGINKYQLNKQLMRVVICVLLTVLAFSETISHKYWSSALKSTVSVSDYAWSYCDFKCTYLENLVLGKDFVVITFSASVFKPNFSACYVSVGTANAPSYVTWSSLITNAWYEAYCGSDTEDYYQKTLGANPTYSIVSVEGAGIGTEIAP